MRDHCERRTRGQRAKRLREQFGLESSSDREERAAIVFVCRSPVTLQYLQLVNFGFRALLASWASSLGLQDTQTVYMFYSGPFFT